MPRIMIILGILLIGLVVVRLATSRRAVEVSPSPEITVSAVPSPNPDTPSSASSPSAYSDQFELSFPQPGSVIATPLTITGRARGSWYFEGSFPVRLFDSEGNMIAEAVAQAQGEWMTEEFVPFIAELEFISPTDAQGKLVLENDNPSGLPEHAKYVELPVQFQQ